MNALISPENRQALRDLALITARHQERDATTQAIGGLAAGAAVTNILTRPSRALQAAVFARGLAELITRPGVRRWLTNTRRTQMAPIKGAESIALRPPIARLLAGGVAERAARLQLVGAILRGTGGTVAGTTRLAIVICANKVSPHDRWINPRSSMR